MSIASEIERLQTAKTDLKTAITQKGVTVADELTIDQYAALVTNIETSGYDTSDADAETSDVLYGHVFYNSNGRQVGSAVFMSAGINTADATATPEQVMSGEIFYNAGGRQIGTLTTKNLTSDATALREQVMSGAIFYNAGGRQTGTMPEGSVTSATNEGTRIVEVSVTSGHHAEDQIIEGGYDTSDASATPEDVISGVVFYNAAGKQVGTLTTGEPEILVNLHNRVCGLDVPDKIESIQDVPIHNKVTTAYCMVINGKLYRTYGLRDSNNYTTEVISDRDDLRYVSTVRSDYPFLAGLTNDGTLLLSVNNSLNESSASSPITWTTIDTGVTAFTPTGDGGIWYQKGSKIYWVIYDNLTTRTTEALAISKIITTWGGDGSGSLNGYDGMGVDTRGRLYQWEWVGDGTRVEKYNLSGKPADGGEWDAVNYFISDRVQYGEGSGYMFATSTNGTLYCALAKRDETRVVDWTAVEGVSNIVNHPGYCESSVNWIWDENTGEEYTETQASTAALFVDANGRLWKATASLTDSQPSGVGIQQIGADTDWVWAPSIIMRNQIAYAQKGEWIVQFLAQELGSSTLEYKQVRYVGSKKVTGYIPLYYGDGCMPLKVEDAPEEVTVPLIGQTSLDMTVVDNLNTVLDFKHYIQALQYKGSLYYSAAGIPTDWSISNDGILTAQSVSSDLTSFTLAASSGDAAVQLPVNVHHVTTPISSGLVAHMPLHTDFWGYMLGKNVDCFSNNYIDIVSIDNPTFSDNACHSDLFAINFPHIFFSMGGSTICARFYQKDTGTGVRYFSYHDSSVGVQVYAQPDGRYVLKVVTAQGTLYDSSGENAAIFNQWVHMAVRCAGNRYTLYINGGAVASVEDTEHTETGMFQVACGDNTSFSGINPLFYGAMKDFTGWNRALSAEEIAALV